MSNPYTSPFKYSTEPSVQPGEIGDSLGIVNVDAAIASFTDGTDYFDAETPDPVGAAASYTVGSGAKWHSLIVRGVVLGNETNVLEIGCSNSAIADSTAFDALDPAQKVTVVTERIGGDTQVPVDSRVNLPGPYRFLAMQQWASSEEADVNVAAAVIAIRASNHYGGINHEDTLDTPT